VTGLTIL